MYKLIFYVPVEQTEKVKEAIFAAGAGRIGEYSHCAWQVLGEGQYMPLSGSDPFLGKINQLEKVPEYKVELVCEKACLKAAIDALLLTHPYETPAYQVVRCESF